MPLGNPAATSDAGVAFASGDRKAEGLFLRRRSRRTSSPRLGRIARGGGIGGADELKATGRRAGRVRQSPDPERLGEPVEHFSGGNQQKVLLGRSCSTSGDRGAAASTSRPAASTSAAAPRSTSCCGRRRGQGQVVVFASSELDELLELGETIITMRSGRVIATYAEGTTREDLLSDLTHRQGVAA